MPETLNNVFFVWLVSKKEKHRDNQGIGLDLVLSQISCRLKQQEEQSFVLIVEVFLNAIDLGEECFHLQSLVLFDPVVMLLSVEIFELSLDSFISEGPHKLLLESLVCSRLTFFDRGCLL